MAGTDGDAQAEDGGGPQDPEDAGSGKEQVPEETERRIVGVRLAGLQTEPRSVLILRRLIVWFFAGVLFALFPIFFDILHQAAIGDVSMIDILKKGEQFVIGGVLTLGATSEAFAAHIPDYGQLNAGPMSRLGSLFSSGTTRIVSGLSALSVALANILAYATLIGSGGALMVNLTILLGIASVGSSAVCVAIAAGR